LDSVPAVIEDDIALGSNAEPRTK